jgi:ribosomal protein S15P/S13E
MQVSFKKHKILKYLKERNPLKNFILIQTLMI